MKWSLAENLQEFRRIPIVQISKNPSQPRKVFNEEEISSLADSIRRYGVLTPLTVRQIRGGYELIAGERRLRASMLAGLTTVPCYIIEASNQQSSLMALVENLQRKDLDCFEEAQGLLRLTSVYGLTQQQAAEQLGKSQSAVANKLRLLRLSQDTIEAIRSASLSERHARVLLRLPTVTEQREALRTMIKRKMTVEQAESYVESLLHPAPPHPCQLPVYKDLRIFFNTVNRAVAAMQTAGLAAQIKKEQQPEQTIVTIVIPSHAQ